MRVNLYGQDYSISIMAKKEKRTFKIESKDIPPEVIDVKSYLEYVEYCNDPLLNENRLFVTSDGTEIDLITPYKYIYRQIADFDDKEQEEIKELAGKARKVLAQINLMKRKAYGSKPIKSRELAAEKMLLSRTVELIELFGRYYSLAETHRIVIGEWKINIGINAIRNFRDDNAALIAEKQEVFKRDYSDIRLGYKRSRLDELTYLYNNRREIYLTSRSKNDYQLLLQTIEQIRKEVEGDKLTIDGHLDVNVEHTLNIHIQQTILKELSIKDIVLGRLAAKTNVDPSWLIAKLRNSYYQKFNHMFLDSQQFMEETIYPSEQVYDFEAIEKKQKLLQQTPVIVPSLNEELTPARQEKGNKTKELLKEIVARKKREIIQREQKFKDMEGGKDV